jgi:hypothetical protein
VWVEITAGDHGVAYDQARDCGFLACMAMWRPVLAHLSGATALWMRCELLISATRPAAGFVPGAAVSVWRRS